MSLIVLDIGATYIKSGLFSPDRLALEAVERVAFPSFTSVDSGRREVDPGEVFRLVEGQIGRLVSQSSDCSAILLSSQMHSLVVLSQGLEPVSAAISWQDQRTMEPHPALGGRSYFDALLGLLTPDERQELGNCLWPGLPITQLYWFREQAQLPDGAIPATLPDFIASRLCGGSGVISDPTNAASSGAFQVERRHWHHAVIEKLGLDRLQWPRVAEPGEPAGYFTARGRKIPIYPAIGDQQAALLGAFLQPDELSLNIATGSQLSRISETPAPGHYQVRPYFEGRFLNTITHIPAGRSLNALINLVAEAGSANDRAYDDMWGTIHRAVGGVRSTDLAVDLSFFPSVTGSRGAISNIHESNLSLGHLFFAAFQSMAESYFQLSRRLMPEKEWKRIVFSGGIAQKSSQLREMILKRFQCEARVCPESEDALWGLCCLGLKYSGAAPSLARATAMVSTYAT